MALRDPPLLQPSRDHACAERLGEQQRVARLRAHIAPDTPRINQPGHSVSELHIVVADGVPADHGAARLGHFGQPAAKNLFENFQIAFFGESHDRKGGNGPSAHGIDIAERVGRGNLSKGKRIVDNRSEEIDRLHQRKARAQTIDAGVIVRFESNQNIVIRLPRQTSQDRIQDARAQFGGTPRRLDGGSKFHLLKQSVPSGKIGPLIIALNHSRNRLRWEQHSISSRSTFDRAA